MEERVKGSLLSFVAVLHHSPCGLTCKGEEQAQGQGIGSYS